MTVLEQLKALRAQAKETATEFVAVSKPANDDRTGYFSNREYISRSDLLRCEGNHTDPPKSVFRMGSMFDMFFTEPQLFDAAQVSDWEMLQLLRAKQAAREIGLMPDAYWKWHDAVISIVAGKPPEPPAFMKMQREIYRNKLEISEGVTIKAKCKLDYWFPDAKTIIDLKSTTKYDRGAFEGDIKNHDLALQAAYYSDVARAESFTLLVVSYANPQVLQKALIGDIAANRLLSKPPYAWCYEFSADELAAGREKYRRLALEGIKKGIIQNQNKL
jgi:hypothetical protein